MARCNVEARLMSVEAMTLGLEYRMGHTDCASLTRLGLKSILGRDPWRDHVPAWNNTTSALKVARSVGGAVSVLTNSGASEVDRAIAGPGDVAVGPETGTDALPQMSMLLPGGRVLASQPCTGVVTVRTDDLTDGTRFFRYEEVAR